MDYGMSCQINCVLSLARFLPLFTLSILILLFFLFSVPRWFNSHCILHYGWIDKLLLFYVHRWSKVQRKMPLHLFSWRQFNFFQKMCIFLPQYLIRMKIFNIFIENRNIWTWYNFSILNYWIYKIFKLRPFLSKIGIL